MNTLLTIDPNVTLQLQAIRDWLAHVPLITTLLIMIVMDMVAGLMVAIDRRALNSTISFRGVTRKVSTLLLVGMAAALEQVAKGVPLAAPVSLFYIVTEAISIMENAAALGVPLPKSLVDLLQKLREDQQKRIKQKSLPPAAPIVHVELPPSASATVVSSKDSATEISTVNITTPTTPPKA